MSRFGEILADVFDRQVYMITARFDSDGDLSATCLVGGDFWYVRQDKNYLQFERVDSATAQIQGYAAGIAEAMGIRLDSDDPFDELAGYLRLDVKCSGGNKPCGKTCIPQRYQCRVKGGNVKQTKSKSKVGKKGLKSGGGKFGRFVNEIGSSPLKRTAFAGTVGALSAGGAAAAYSLHHADIPGEIKSGIDEAKAKIKEGSEKSKLGVIKDTAKTAGNRIKSNLFGKQNHEELQERTRRRNRREYGTNDPKEMIEKDRARKRKNANQPK